MTLQHSWNAKQYFVWQKLSGSVREYRGTIAAVSELDALAAANARWGVGILIKEFQYGRTLAAW